MKAIRRVCDKYGVLMILDEVMCGVGRTGHLYACAEDGVEPDILTIGKGLAAGYQPLSAMLVRERVYDAIASNSGMLRNGQTFAFHAAACATALEVQNIVEEEGLLAKVQLRGEQLRGLLRETFADHPNVGDVRGRGLFVGLELVADRATKATLPPTLGSALRSGPWQCRKACCATLWAAPSTANTVIICCSRRRSLPPRTKSRRSSRYLRVSSTRRWLDANDLPRWRICCVNAQRTPDTHPTTRAEIYENTNSESHRYP
jgi:adenosylmethionine-8-amino-7-oxononanoate aminotransferase